MKKKGIVEKIKKTTKRLGSLGWLLKLTKPFVLKLLGLVILGVVITLLGVSSSVVSKYIIDAATNATSMTLSIIIMISITAVSLVLSFSSSLISTVVNEKYAFHIRQKMFDRILRTCWIDIIKYHSGDLLTRLKSDIGAITGGITGVVPQIIVLTVQLFAAFFTLFHFDKTIAVFALILGPVSALAMWVFGKRLKRLQMKVQQSESKYSSFLQESIENIMIIKSFTAEERSSARLKELFLERLSWVVKKNRTTALAGALMGFVFTTGYLTAFIYGAIKISEGQITFGTMTIFLTLVSQVQGPFLSLAKTFPQIMSILASSERVTEILNLEQEEIKQLENPVFSVGVEIKDVNFKYLDDMVFEDANLNILPGDIIAVVGPSGIGKTTLVRLIMSFIKPQAGHLSFYLDRTNVISAGPVARSFIDYVPQGNTLFSGTISDNLKMGKQNASQEEMVQALTFSAAEFVLELPDGLETMIGERGHRLSEGQAQRIAIARAIIRGSPLLILDEATSALDEDTELKILKGINNLPRKPTCIIITHRKSILAFCNRKIEIGNGRLVENDKGIFAMREI